MGLLYLLRLKRVVPRPDAFLFSGKGTSSLKQTHLRYMFKKPASTIVSPDPLSHTSSVSSHLKTPENTEEDPFVPEVADEGGIQMEYSLISSTAQV